MNYLNDLRKDYDKIKKMSNKKDDEIERIKKDIKLIKGRISSQSLTQQKIVEQSDKLQVE